MVYNRVGAAPKGADITLYPSATIPEQRDQWGEEETVIKAKGFKGGRAERSPLLQPNSSSELGGRAKGPKKQGIQSLGGPILTDRFDFEAKPTRSQIEVGLVWVWCAIQTNQGLTRGPPREKAP